MDTLLSLAIIIIEFLIGGQITPTPPEIPTNDGKVSSWQSIIEPGCNIPPPNGGTIISLGNTEYVNFYYTQACSGGNLAKLFFQTDKPATIMIFGSDGENPLATFSTDSTQNIVIDDPVILQDLQIFSIK